MSPLETPADFERPTRETVPPPVGPVVAVRPPLAFRGFSPQNTILAGAVVGWFMAGRAGTKGQGVRLMDVFILGPLMAQAGLWESRDQPWAQALIRAAGAATVTYNLRNFLTTARRDA